MNEVVRESAVIARFVVRTRLRVLETEPELMSGRQSDLQVDYLVSMLV